MQMEELDINQQNEQPEKCAKCEEFPEDILMLACNHDLCLLCAAHAFASPENKFARQNSSIKCNLCGTQTQLDQSSIYELEKIVIAAKQQKNYNTSSEQLMETTSSQQQMQQSSETQLFSQNLNQISVGSSNKPPLNEMLLQNKLQQNQQSYLPVNPSQQQQQQQYYKTNSRDFCSDHPDEYISYYCFDCNSKCICPECVIHGAHKGHEVQTIKKAYPLILQKVKESQEILHEKIDEVKMFQDKFSLKQRDQTDQFKNFKKQVVESFDELRKKIDIKEQEILQIQDQLEKEQSKNISFDFNLMNSKLESLANEIQAINQYISSKDEIQLMNYYSDSMKLQELNKQKDQTLQKKLEQDLEEFQTFFTKGLNSNPNSILSEISNITQHISKIDFMNISQSSQSKNYNEDNIKEITNNFQNIMGKGINNENINTKSATNTLNSAKTLNATQQQQQYKHQQSGSNNSLKNFDMNKVPQYQQQSQSQANMNFIKQN